MKRAQRFLFTTILSFILTCFPLFAIGQHADNSVLQSGNWWKMETGACGLYKITTEDISQLTGVSTSDIALYSHQGGVLSTLNGDQRIDDLEEIAVEVHDNNGNGIFEAGDYILFYGTGAYRWVYDSELDRNIRQSHPYSESNYVYLTIQSGGHKRVQTQTPTTPTGATVTKCRIQQYHENDLVNVFKSGQVWLGERFSGSTNQRNVSFTLPATPSLVKIRYALASVSSESSNFHIVANGVSGTHNFSKYNPYSTFIEQIPANGSNIDIGITYNYNENTAVGYLDYIEVDAEVPLAYSGGISLFRTPLVGAVTRSYEMSGGDNNTRIWDVTEYNDIVEMATTSSGGSLSFANAADRWRNYVAFKNSSNFSKPLSITPIANQNIHGMDNAELVIVTHSSFLDEAQRLANLHSIYDNIGVIVVTQEQVFNEFSNGQKDPMAIREMMRMFYNRWKTDPTKTKPLHLLLFGKGTYDNKDLLDKSMPTVVTYQTLASFDDDGESLASDDVMTYLDDGESVSEYSSMDINVGRLPAKNVVEARHIVDKIERYITRRDLFQDEIRGDWRNSVALLADDADPGNRSDTVFTSSSEYIARQIAEQYPQFTVDKIYADAYIQRSGADGSYFPDVNNALKKRMDYGCLILNYIGHGSSQYIGTERFMMKSDISNYANSLQLPFFITSTCTFGRYDDPDETCGAEEFLLADGAGIACLAASRPISHTQVVNAEMVMQALNPENTIGDAIRISKNIHYTRQSLALLGDPALKLSHPKYRVEVTAVNGNTVDTNRCDTALVLSTVTIEGEIHNSDGALVSDFDGYIFPEVYDRVKNAQTFANDNEGCEVSYTIQNSLLYKGRATVNGGRFSYKFTVPRDVAYKFEPAKLTHYAKSGDEDASGSYSRLVLGGFDESVVITETRPEIRLFMNDTNFRNGGITDDSPTLLVKLSDSIGINAVGSGLGHDITAIVDGNQNSTIILNDFYETDISDENCGEIRYELSSLSRGRHSIIVKAWNIFNYSNTSEIIFYVHSDDTVTTQFRTTPNPASTHAMLDLEHNIKGEITSAHLDIFNMQGHPIWSTDPAVSADSYVVGPVNWNLTSSSGTRVPPGVYIARFTIRTADGDLIHETGKIIVK